MVPGKTASNYAPIKCCIPASSLHTTPHTRLTPHHGLYYSQVGCHFVCVCVSVDVCMQIFLLVQVCISVGVYLGVCVRVYVCVRMSVAIPAYAQVCSQISLPK